MATGRASSPGASCWSICVTAGSRSVPSSPIGDGNLGFWKALRQVYGAAREQRCWVHKTANVLNKLPKGVQAKAKQQLHAIWMAETREAAEAAFDHFVDAYRAKYDKAVACLVRDREALLAFYDFPAEHWKHVRTTSWPAGSCFAQRNISHPGRHRGSGLSEKSSPSMRAPQRNREGSEPSAVD